MNKVLFRKRFVTFVLIAVFAFLWVSASLTLPVDAQVQQPYIQQIEPGLFVAGIPTNEFEYYAAPQSAGHQRQTNWCWAACIQMVLNYHGVAVTQEQVVQRIFNGTVTNEPGRLDQILTALSGWAFSTNGRPVMLTSTSVAFSGSEIVTDLAMKWPIIVGVQMVPGKVGHAYVMTAVTYRVDKMNQPIFVSAILRDPWPENPSRIEVPWEQFQKNWMFMARMRVTRT